MSVSLLSLPENEASMSSDRAEPELSQIPMGCFATTHWSVVQAAGEGQSPQADAALEKLCRMYWYPLYAYVRRRGYGPADAEDLTQDFFAHLLRKNYPARADRAKGRFRTFLLHALAQFLVDQRERVNALKRGGGQVFISLDEEAPEDRYRLEVPDELTPEKLFERRWAQAVLDRALDRLRGKFIASGKEREYEVLKSFEPGEQSALSYAQAAARLGVSESAVKSMIHRLRQRHRELVREEIAHTVPTVAEIDDELRYLVAILRG
jgi:RNA polymerase sigma-70 factor (ECF subfamily)